MSEAQFQSEVMDELKQQETTMKTYNDLKKINVNVHTEKKGQLTYLSWAWAIDKLLENDPMATWEFPEPKYFGETVMVFCNITALGKTMHMQLPVMDNRNNAIAKPDSRKISDATMRCLAKCVACFGIGLYIYAGEDLPKEDLPEVDIDSILAELGKAKDTDELTVAYRKAIDDCNAEKQYKELVKQRAIEIKSLFK
mgnify:CR=1 FL=1|tara:strand:- start:959 stop:1549 length:591 start_codon:yes stop_codon:yes gene_type:complete